MIRTAPILSRTGYPVQRIVLSMPADFEFEPGQYIEVLHPDGPIPLSIASAPRRLPELHLHYLSNPDAPEAGRMDELLDTANALEIRGPAGDVRLPVPLPAPALIAAGGTGIAQAMCFIDTFAATHPGARVTLLWCADEEADFYLRDELEALEAPWLENVLVADSARTAKNRGMIWLSEHGAAFAGKSPVVLAGGPGFVHSACDTLAAVGVAAGQIQSDVFSYAPRT